MFVIQFPKCRQGTIAKEAIVSKVTHVGAGCQLPIQESGNWAIVMDEEAKVIDTFCNFHRPNFSFILVISSTNISGKIACEKGAVTFVLKCNAIRSPL